MRWVWQKSFWLILILTLSVPWPLAWSGDSNKGKEESGKGVLLKSRGREHRKKGIHDGNKILTVFYNFGGIGNGTVTPRVESGIYPKGSGHSYIYEFTPVVGSEVVDIHGRIIHIFSDGMVSARGRDESPLGYQWGFEPLPGYANPNQDHIAMSDDPDSWPLHWPDRDSTWDGFWNGEYGKYSRADQESYFRMNDYYNDEFEFYPDPTDSSKRGLAVEVAVRGYQWAHVAAEDIIIWTYRITNTGKVLYEKMLFGMYGDADVGDAGDVGDDDAWFDILNDIVYQWDHDNRGSWGGPPAYFGWKFLESPGNPLDGVDNDQDGMIDESQYDGIDNDQDWDPVTDDVGSDGLGPLDPEYPGPDLDGTEGNGVPDFGEPNFEITDNDEADQIGLTSFNAAPWPTITADNDEDLWLRTLPGNFSEIMQTVDLTFLYGSGYFPLPPGHTRKFAIALLFGEDYQDIIRNAVTMQHIYDADYNFAKPPLKPRVVAIPGDHKVTLYWDSRAEHSRDPIYGYDFEGYTIYRSTEPGFLESWIITDADGNKTFNKPIAQFDLKDGLVGPHPIGINGIHFQMGRDTGLRYVFVDTTVENGQTYYYAVCSYDKGYDLDFYERGLSPYPHLMPIAPAECTKRIDIDPTGKVLATDLNTVVVTPNAPAAGYQPPEVAEIVHTSGIGTGILDIRVIDPLSVIDGERYELRFHNTAAGLTYTLTDVTKDSVIFKNSPYLHGEDFNPTFDGLRLTVTDEDTLAIDFEDSRWIKGESNYQLYVNPNRPYRDYPNPADYEIRFLGTHSDTGMVTGHITPFKVYNVITGRYIDFRVAAPRDTNYWTYGNEIYFYEYIEELGRKKYTWVVTLVPPEGDVPPVPPDSGDVFLIATSRPFSDRDIFQFQMKGASLNKQKAAKEMERIAVVPNPYVVTASWEPQHYYTSGRGKRKIDFIHLPPKCTIKIFTLRGHLVDVIEHDSPVTDGSESWDLLSKDGMEVAYGVYIYYVEAPGIGKKIGKFAVIK